MLEVAQGEVDEVGLVLHAGGVASEVDGLDQGGADAAHRVDHQVTGTGERTDDGGSDGRQHLAGVAHRLGRVASLALQPGRALSSRQHRRQRLDAGEFVVVHRALP
nr:hypothetical protein [Actinomadura geliboluensis]